jgi:hypothetical protein
LTYSSKVLAPSGSRVEKHQSPAAWGIPEWCLEYQRRIEAAQRDYLLLKEQGEPEEAEQGQGEVEMTEANTDLVHRQLSELAQQSVHVIQTFNEETDVLEEKFDSLMNGITIMESRLQTEKVQIDSEVSGVESMMQFQQAILEELRSGIHVLQEQDNQIVGEAKALFVGVRSELEAQSKKIMDNGLQIFAQKVLIQAVQKSVGILSKRIDRVNKVVATITESLKGVPSKRDLRQHQATMDERLAQVEEINTRLTTPREQYKFSESTHFEFRQNAVGPSVTHQYTHPHRQLAFLSPSVSSLRDTESEFSWNFGIIRGGAGSNGAAGGPDGGAAGGADDGAAGGRGAAGDPPPPPPDPPPSNYGGPGGRQMSR